MKLLCIDNGLSFNEDLVRNSPLGGSETSLFFLAKGLSETGTNVTLVNNTPETESVNGNYTILSRRLVKQIDTNEFDVILFSRVEPFKTQGKTLNLYYTGDAYDQPLMRWVLDKQKLTLVDKILCVSEWQMSTFNKYLNIPMNKMSVLGNCIDTESYLGNAKRNKNRYIFASVPYKGLEFISTIYDHMHRVSKNDELEFVVYSSMALYNQPDDKYKDVFNGLSIHNGIDVKSPIPPKELANELLTSIGYIHPNSYHETFGMVLVQAQLCGCVPVTTNKGAVTEVIQHGKTGLITDYPNIENEECLTQFCEYALNIESSNISRDTQIDWCKQWDYRLMSEKFKELANEISN